MIAVGEKDNAVVLVFEAKSAKQTLTDEEAVALHAQLGLLLRTRADRAKGHGAMVSASDVVEPTPQPPTGRLPLGAGQRPRPQPSLPNSPRGSLDGPRANVLAELGLDPDEDPVEAAKAADEAELEARGEVPGKNAPARPSPESQQKRRAAKMAAAGLMPEGGSQ